MKTHEPQHSNFWLGFILGAGATSAGLYLFGTEKGRKQMRGALDLTENLEGTVDTYQENERHAPRVINSDEVLGADDSTVGTMMKVFGVLKIFATKYSDRKRAIRDGEVVG